MRVLRTALRWFFAIESFGIFIGILGFAGMDRPTQPLAPSSIALLFVVLSYALVLGSTAGFTAWRMKSAGPLTRWSVLAASILNLVVFPIGTAMAIAGIVCVFRKACAADEAAPRHKPLPGDGTGSRATAIFVVVQVVMTWGAYTWALPWAAKRWTHHGHLTPLELLMSIAAAAYGSAFVHEIGHFVFGRAVGFKLVGFRVGFFELRRRSGRWHFRFCDSPLGGHAAMVPSSAERLREKHMIMGLGGPLASGLLALAGMALLASLPNVSRGAGVTLVLLTVLGACDLIANLMPMAIGVNYSDGARLWQLWRRGPWCDYLCAMSWMGLSQATPTRPRDWPREMMEGVAAFAAQLPDAAGVLGCVYAHFEDSGDIEKASVYLDRAIERARPGTEISAVLARERAYFEAWHRANAEESALWLAKAPADPSRPDHWRARAAVALAAGDLKAAEDAWRRGTEILAKAPETGSLDMSRRQFRELATALSRPAAAAGYLTENPNSRASRDGADASYSRAQY